MGKGKEKWITRRTLLSETGRTRAAYGHRVKWAYEHQIGGVRSRGGVCRFWRTKYGIFTGLVKHTSKHWHKAGSVQMAHVTFEGNSTRSVVPVDDLLFLAPAGEE